MDNAQVRPGIQEVGGNRVLEGVKMPRARGHVGALAVVLHQFVQSPATDGGMVAREEERRGVALTLFQVGFDGFEFIRWQWVQSGQRILEAVDAQPVLLHVEVGGTQYPYLRGAQAMAVGEQEDGIVALGGSALDRRRISSCVRKLMLAAVQRLGVVPNP